MTTSIAVLLFVLLGIVTTLAMEVSRHRRDSREAERRREDYACYQELLRGLEELRLPHLGLVRVRSDGEKLRLVLQARYHPDRTIIINCGHLLTHGGIEVCGYRVEAAIDRPQPDYYTRVVRRGEFPRIREALEHIVQDCWNYGSFSMIV
jgi:hypothetical protein